MNYVKKYLPTILKFISAILAAIAARNYGVLQAGTGETDYLSYVAPQLAGAITALGSAFGVSRFLPAAADSDDVNQQIRNLCGEMARIEAINGHTDKFEQISQILQKTAGGDK